MKVHGNDTWLQREKGKVVKENWRVGRTINQTGYARGEIYLGRKMEMVDLQCPPKISRQFKT